MLNGITGKPDRLAHLAWCKARALDYLDVGDIRSAITTILLDLTKNDETRALCTHPVAREGMRICLGGDLHAARAFVLGFE